jgi:cytochrome bd-type quinol oxidase subunit 2
MAGASPATICRVTQGTDAEASGLQWWRWLLAGAVLPLLGAAAVVGMIEAAGGDLGAWETWQAVAALAAAVVVPAGLSVWLVWRGGALQAAASAVVCAGLQFALVFGVGFVALGLGPG